MLKGAAKTLVEKTTQIHPRSLRRAAGPLVRTCVKRTIEQNPPKLSNRIIHIVLIYKSNHVKVLVLRFIANVN